MLPFITNRHKDAVKKLEKWYEKLIIESLFYAFYSEFISQSFDRQAKSCLFHPGSATNANLKITISLSPILKCNPFENADSRIGHRR
jgi:hypothetical protein